VEVAVAAEEVEVTAVGVIVADRAIVAAVMEVHAYLFGSTHQEAP
jgi:hypothetical protein